MFRESRIAEVADRAGPLPPKYSAERADVRLASLSMDALPYAWIPREKRADLQITLTGVRATAYNHDESDHIVYGNASAAGTELTTGKRHSVAADWSVFPLGTKFRIKGQPDVIYEVDDYGSALVGTGTIDIYQPSLAAMARWGTRSVDMEVIEWGSYSNSRKVMEPRTAYSHIRRMLAHLPGRQPDKSARDTTPATASSAPATDEGGGLSASNQ